MLGWVYHLPCVPHDVCMCVFIIYDTGGVWKQHLVSINSWNVYYKLWYRLVVLGWKRERNGEGERRERGRLSCLCPIAIHTAPHCLHQELATEHKMYYRNRRTGWLSFIKVFLYQPVNILLLLLLLLLSLTFLFQSFKDSIIICPLVVAFHCQLSICSSFSIQH